MSGNLVTLKLRMYPVSFVNSKFSLELLGSTKLLFLASISKKIQFRDRPIQFVGKKNTTLSQKHSIYFQKSKLVPKKEFGVKKN